MGGKGPGVRGGQLQMRQFKVGESREASDTAAAAGGGVAVAADEAPAPGGKCS